MPYYIHYNIPLNRFNPSVDSERSHMSSRAEQLKKEGGRNKARERKRDYTRSCRLPTRTVCFFDPRQRDIPPWPHFRVINNFVFIVSRMKFDRNELYYYIFRKMLHCRSYCISITKKWECENGEKVKNYPLFYTTIYWEPKKISA